MLEEHLHQLIEDLELESLSPKDDKGMYLLTFNPTLTISFKALDPGIFVFTSISPIPEKKREELFILLMKANFLGQGTGGACLGMDAEEKLITLSLSLPFDMNYKTFKETIEDFANFTDYWKEELIRHEKEAEAGFF